MDTHPIISRHSSSLKGTPLRANVIQNDLTEFIQNLSPASLVLIFGRPGSGKTSLVQYFMNKDPIYIGMGQLLRELSSKRNDLHKYFQTGQLIPDPLAIYLIRKALRSHLHNNKIIILEGHPQTLCQYDFLMQFLCDHNIKPVGIFINTSAELCFDRCLKRGRTDDCPKILTRRFKGFEEVTFPVIQRAKNDFFVIDIGGENEK